MYLDKSGIQLKAFTENRPVKTWYFGFLHRHPKLKMARAEKLEQSRAMGMYQRQRVFLV